MNSISHPLVSIVIPVFNGSNYMCEAIDSALAQTYPNIEILVINDGSTDEGATHEIAMSYGDKIRYFQKENGGVVSALNVGIEQMHGEYFAWLSHDDLYQPNKIEMQVKALRNHTGERTAFCVCNCIFVDENGSEIAKSQVQKNSQFDKPECYLFLGCTGLNGLMVLIPRSLFDRCGLFKPSLATHEYDMWLRIMAVADVVVVPDNLVKMRVHSQQLSLRKKENVVKEIDEFMGDGIRNISKDIFRSYVEARCDAEGITYVFKLLISYMLYQSYPSAARETLAKIRRMIGDSSKLADQLYNQLFGDSNIGNIMKYKEYIKQSQQKNKPITVICCENSTDAVFNEVSMGLAAATAECEIVILYQTMNEEIRKLLNDMHVMAFQYIDRRDGNLPISISLLCYLINAKVFWYIHSGKGIQYTEAFRFFKMMEIAAISSCHANNEMLTNNQSAYATSFYKPEKLLSEPLLLTYREKSKDRYLYNTQNLIVIPEDNFAALVRWKRIFGVLLGTAQYNQLSGLIEEKLSDILGSTEIAQSEYVNQYVRDFIADVDRKVADMVNYYEQRTFWKLTKPLRFSVWFFQKAKKAIRRILKREASFRSLMSRIPLALKNRRTSI